MNSMRLVSTFSSRLSEEIKKKGMSRNQFAIALGLRSQSVSMYCLGQTLPRIDTIVDMANYLDVSVDYLCGR